MMPAKCLSQGKLSMKSRSWFLNCQDRTGYSLEPGRDCICDRIWLLRVPWTARRSNQLILEEINPEYHWRDWLILRLKLQIFDDLMRKTDSEEILMLGKVEGRKRRGWQKMRWLHDINDSMDMCFSQLREMVKDSEGLVCCSPWGHKESDTTERLNNISIAWYRSWYIFDIMFNWCHSGFSLPSI